MCAGPAPRPGPRPRRIRESPARWTTPASSRRSGSGRSARSERRRPGAAVTSSSTRSKRPARRSMVAESKRSVLNSRAPRRPPSSSVRSSIRSNLETPGSRSGLRISRSASTARTGGAFCSTTRTWKSGVRDRSRSGCSSSTSFSKGRSWCAKAPWATSRRRPSSSRNDGSPDRSARRTRVLVKKPISPSISGRRRLATGEPTAMSSCPVQLRSRDVKGRRARP